MRDLLAGLKPDQLLADARDAALLSLGWAAGAADMPSYRIMQHTRHKSHEQVAGYNREGQKWTKSGLNGVGF